MKLKRLIIIAIALITLGVGWFVASQLSSNEQPQKKNAQSDGVAPSVTLHIPTKTLEQAITEKSIEISVDASDNKLVERVEYVLDGKVVARSIRPPFKVTINLSGLTAGEHTLQAVAYDFAGNTGKSKVFKFTVEGSKDSAGSSSNVAPADDTSKEIVSRSDKKAARAKTVARSNNTSSGGNNTPPADNSGTTDPDEEEPTDPFADPSRSVLGWYTSAPAQVCDSDIWNKGPATKPAGAITVPAGDNTGFDFGQAGKTYWFEAGEHTLGTGQFSKIVPEDDSTYIGAPGAILDGKNNNQYAFAGHATNVRIAYLEIRNFGRGLDNNNEGVINHDAGDGWVMEYLYAHHNDGAAVFIGSDNTVRYNCLKDNGQYGFSMFKEQVNGESAITDIVVDHNEITGNNQDDWEALEEGCGCTGGGKFWDVKGARVTNNYVHHNLSVGLWADTNDIDFLFDSNWVEQNSGEGIWYEISYNATISRNVLKRNNWGGGNHNQGSPAPAIYISESGGDSRLQSSTSGSTDLQIKQNLLEDNFSGISVYENANRFCNSNGNTSKTYCTPFVLPTIIAEPRNYTYPNPINAIHPCYTSINTGNYAENCRWHSKNVQVSNNEFRFTQSNVPCIGTFCGVQALFATGANNISWAPTAYNVSNVQNDVMFNNNNKFFNNTYIGDWRFVKGSNEGINWDTWKAAPYLQDAGSTITGQTPVANILDANTATFEGSIGLWQDWFSTTLSRSAEEAHSGSYSLKIDLSASGSWAAELSNWPGFEVRTSGQKRVSFWAKQGAGAVSNVRLRVTWYNADGQAISDAQNPVEVPLALSQNWQEATADITAPTGSNTMFLQILSSSGGAGSSVFIDDITVADN